MKYSVLVALACTSAAILSSQNADASSTQDYLRLIANLQMVAEKVVTQERYVGRSTLLNALKLEIQTSCEESAEEVGRFACSSQLPPRKYALRMRHLDPTGPIYLDLGVDISDANIDMAALLAAVQWTGVSKPKNDVCRHMLWKIGPLLHSATIVEFRARQPPSTNNCENNLAGFDIIIQHTPFNFPAPIAR